MARLSNTTREKMAVALVKHRFAETAAELVAQSQELFRKLYDGHYDTETRKHIAAIIKKHRKAFGKATALEANVGGREIAVGAVSLGWKGVSWPVEVEARPTAGDIGGWRNGIGIGDEHPLRGSLVEFADRRDTLRESCETAYREALGALNQFSTGKRLGEEWPEAMPVIGDLIPEDDRTLPVVQVANLNSKFGLPPETLAA